jgi:hypothetical protein
MRAEVRAKTTEAHGRERPCPHLSAGSDTTPSSAVSVILPSRAGGPGAFACARRVSTLRYCEIELATEEKTLLALEPMSRIVPTTMTKITANMTAYSAMSCPASSRHNLRRRFLIKSSKGNGVE